MGVTFSGKWRGPLAQRSSTPPATSTPRTGGCRCTSSRVSRRS